MDSQETREASTTTSDGCKMVYTYRAGERKVMSVTVIDVMQRMCPATARDRDDAQWHLDHCM